MIATETTYFYNILPILNQLPKVDYDKAMLELPVLMGIKREMFKRHLVRKENEDNPSMTIDQLLAIATYLNKGLDELVNFRS